MENGPVGSRRVYEKPTVTSERAFETLAAECTYLDTHFAGCNSDFLGTQFASY